LIANGIITANLIALEGVRQGYIGTLVEIQLPAPKPFRPYVSLIDYFQDTVLFEITEIGTYSFVYKPILPFQFEGSLGPILVASASGLRPNINNRRCLFTPLQEKELLTKAMMGELGRGFFGSDFVEPYQALKMLRDNVEQLTQSTALVPREGNIPVPLIVYEEIPFIHADGKTEMVLAPVLCIPKSFDNPRLRDWTGGLFSSGDILIRGASQHDSTLRITGHIDAQGKVTFTTFNRLTQERRIVTEIHHVLDTNKQESLCGLKRKTTVQRRAIAIYHAEPGNTVTGSEVVYEDITHVQQTGLTITAGTGGIHTENVQVIEQRSLIETNDFNSALFAGFLSRLIIKGLP
jgi:hypothetical protein